MDKEIKISGCLIVPTDASCDEIVNRFLAWVESNGWHFGGGFREIIDGYDIISD